MLKIGQRILMRRARDYLRRYQPTLLGITGSTNQNIVRSAIDAALADKSMVRAALGSHSRSDVAQAILGVNKHQTGRSWFNQLISSRIREMAEDEPSIIVLELAADQPGQVDDMARTFPFNIGVVTNVQSSSLHLFTSLDLVAHEHTSLITALPPNGVACLNVDDPHVAGMSEHTKAQVIWYGQTAGSDVQLLRTQRLNGGHASELRIHGRPFELNLPHIIAAQQLSAVLAAVAALVALKVNLKEALLNLGGLIPPPGSMRKLAGRANAQLLDDSLDATPESMIMNLGTLSEMPAQRRLAILGDIKNLGTKRSSWHQAIGQSAAQSADVLIAVGENMREAGAVALKSGSCDVHQFMDARDVGKWIGDFLKEGDLVLISGSRAMHMEEVVKRLLADPVKDANQLVK